MGNWVIRSTAAPKLKRGASSSDSATRWMSVTDCRTRLGASFSDDGSLIGDLLDEASMVLEQALYGRPDIRVALTSYQVDGVLARRNTKLRLPLFPVDPDAISLVTQRGTTLTVNSDYVVRGGCILERGAGWPVGDSVYGSDGVAKVQATIDRAGYLVDGQIADWEASSTYTAGQWVRPVAATDSPFLMVCTGAGTSDATEPTWSTTAGGEVADSSATWKGYRVRELPKPLAQAAYLCVHQWINAQPEGLVEWRAGSFSERFSEGTASSFVPERALAIVARYR